MNNKVSYLNLLKYLGSISIAIFLHYDAHFLYLLHTHNSFKKDSFLEYLSINSNLFVIFFFMASGILYYKVYYHKILNDNSLKKFFVGRIIRIYPLVLVTSCYMYLINILLFKYNKVLWYDGSLSLWDLFSDILFGGKAIFGLKNTLNSPIWYIGILMFCYFIAYILTKINKKYHHFYIFSIPVFLGLLMYYSHKTISLWNISIAGGLINFFIGVILGWLFQKIDNIKQKKIRLTKKIMFLELICFIIILTRHNHDLYMSNKYLSYSFLFFPELLILFYKSKILEKICNNRIIEFLGKISYSIYLWNFPILSTFYFLIINKYIKVKVESGWFIFLNFSIHMVISIISYFIIDKKLIPYLKNKIQLKDN